jgi:hypothetical protein
MTAYNIAAETMKDIPDIIKYSIVFVFIVLLVVVAARIHGNLEQNMPPPSAPVWLGVRVIPLDKTVSENFNLAYKRGLLVRNVVPGSPADEAGIIEGDIIRRIEDIQLINTGQLKTYIRTKSPGQKARIVYIRGITTITTCATLELSQIIDPNSRLVYGAYPVSAPPTNKPYPYFYFGDENKPDERDSDP